MQYTQFIQWHNENFLCGKKLDVTQRSIFQYNLWHCLGFNMHLICLIVNMLIYVKIQIGFNLMTTSIGSVAEKNPPIPQNTIPILLLNGYLGYNVIYLGDAACFWHILSNHFPHYYCSAVSLLVESLARHCYMYVVDVSTLLQPQVPLVLALCPLC